jgi:hypothetical protein
VLTHPCFARSDDVDLFLKLDMLGCHSDAPSAPYLDSLLQSLSAPAALALPFSPTPPKPSLTSSLEKAHGIALPLVLVNLHTRHPVVVLYRQPRFVCPLCEQAPTSQNSRYNASTRRSVSNDSKATLTRFFRSSRGTSWVSAHGHKKKKG